MRRTSKALATLIAVVALLTANTSPSAAETAAITGGTSVVNLVPPITQTLGGTTASCTSTITGAFTTSLTSATFTLTILSHFVYSGGNYILVLSGTVHAGSTHVTTAGAHLSKHKMTFDNSTPSSTIILTNVMVYTSDSATDCDPTNGTAKCGDINVSIQHFHGYLTIPTGTTIAHNATTSRHTIPVSSTIVFDNSTSTSAGPPYAPLVANIAAAGCTPPFSSLNGKTATISGLTSHVTSATP